ncbi:hypothetical protein [Cronobacter muytjensii]|uniref:hypothetical protein n=2 Tax=Cronobacter muytjensii TaxID=413501 RepID=UPI001CD9EF04|nr:hypothetical protein [Cronobacter muytjensii]
MRQPFTPRHRRAHHCRRIQPDGSAGDTDPQPVRKHHCLTRQYARRARAFLCPSLTHPERTTAPAARKLPTATPETDPARLVALTQPRPHKIKRSQTKTALHRTRLQVLDRKIFSVLFFYKRHGQTAPALAHCQKSETEMIENNFGVFHFFGSLMDLPENSCACFNWIFLILRQRKGASAAMADGTL